MTRQIRHYENMRDTFTYRDGQKAPSYEPEEEDTTSIEEETDDEEE